MIRGLVIGKFYPPHRGHSFLIDTALASADSIDVLVVNNPAYGIPASKRAEWIRQLHPKARVRIIEDINDDDNSEAWAAHTIDFLGYAPDVVFSSEAYGDAYAHSMGARHVAVDKKRKTVPISGTEVRADTLATREYQSEVVKEALAIRVVIMGAESTGTTTLTKALAGHYHAPWAPEVGRYYTESLLPTPFEWNDADFVHIAKLQQAYESAIARKKGGLVLCDTNATATTLWQKRYLGHISKEVADIARADIVSLYIVTGDEIPFEDDGTRDGEHIRHDMHDWFVELAKSSGVPYTVVRGNRQERMKQACLFVDTHLKGLRLIQDTVDSPST